jgi:dephospho-CoA kinase
LRPDAVLYGNFTRGLCAISGQRAFEGDGNAVDLQASLQTSPYKGHTMKLRTTFATLTLALLSAAVLAQTAQAADAPATPRVDAREANQEKRISNGVNNGSLTARETLRLEREQKRINVAEANAKADGTVTKNERKHLHKMQNAASRDIYKQKHDAQTAAPPAAKP